jgi:hypothetical protein
LQHNRQVRFDIAFPGAGEHPRHDSYRHIRHWQRAARRFVVQLQSGTCIGPDLAIDLKSVGLLKSNDCSLSVRPKVSIGSLRIKTQFLQLLLKPYNVRP